MHLLILGGTREARELSTWAVSQGMDVLTSLAGRVSNPALPAGEVRIGGFGGVDGLAEFIESEGIGAVVDATHPFAERISANAASATAIAGVPLIHLHRPAWQPGPQDRWISVPSMAAAADASRNYPRVFLTIGRQQLGAFTRQPAEHSGEPTASHDQHTHYLIRCVEAPNPQDVPLGAEVILSRGPFSVAGERALLEAHGIQALVTKNSGGALTEAKLHAAAELGIDVIMVERAPLPEGPHISVVEGVANAAQLLSALR